MRIIGLDIGTTTICASVVDSENGAVLEAITEKNRAFLQTAYAWQKQQDPQVILDTARGLIQRLLAQYAPVGDIGVTGQMHGIVYLSADGAAVSPLHIWQDGSGDQICATGKTYAQELAARTGYPLATGFGAVTHFFHVSNGLVPETAAVFCTIHDYVAMQLAQRTTPLLHASDAASFGLYSLENAAFDADAIHAGGMRPEMFPAVGGDYEKLGETSEGVPVFSAIGDNQASFLGSVRDMRGSILVNMGTGSQISLLSDTLVRDVQLETRPCVEGTYLLVGSSLCGGRAYALLEQFCRTLVQEAGLACDSLYPVLDRLSADFENLSDKLTVHTQFSGTRREPQKRGSIENLGTENFTPRHLTVGVLEGTVNELYDLYAGRTVLPDFRPRALVGSGNGIRKGAVLRRMFEKRFGAPLCVPAHTEEAAYGAALYAMVGAGIFSTMQEAQHILRYEA